MAKSYYYDDATAQWAPLVQGLVGPQGPQGPQGETGPQGPPGIGLYAMEEGGEVPPDLPEGTIVFTY